MKTAAVNLDSPRRRTQSILAGNYQRQLSDTGKAARPESKIALKNTYRKLHDNLHAQFKHKVPVQDIQAQRQALAKDLGGADKVTLIESFAKQIGLDEMDSNTQALLEKETRSVIRANSNLGPAEAGYQALRNLLEKGNTEIEALIGSMADSVGVSKEVMISRILTTEPEVAFNAIRNTDTEQLGRALSASTQSKLQQA